MGERRSSRRDDVAMGGSHMNALDWTAVTLAVVGGLNWGLVGLFDLDLVAAMFGARTAISRLIYAVIGVSALYSIYAGLKLTRHGPH
jgi:uncharacterized membrane protein YuzA (DUF378 family)